MVKKKKEMKEVNAQYDKKNKTIIFQTARISFVPAYLYYYVGFLEKQLGKIKRVIFLLDTSRAYNVEELKGVEDWSKIDLKDVERIDENESK